MKSMYFIHFVVEFKTLKFTLAIEKVEIFNEILYVETSNKTIILLM
jgi:hypothetical protein